MTTKAKLTTAAIALGIIIGAIIGYAIAGTALSYIMITALALAGLGYLMALVLALVIDTRNDRSYPVPDPFDTSYEE